MKEQLLTQEIGFLSFILSISVVLLGIIVIGAILFFGRILFQEKNIKLSETTVKEIFIELQQHSKTIRREALQALADSFVDSRSRRNEFWAIYGQLVIAITIITVLTILLLARVITAEAGLPILSAISGFALAKSIGVASSKTNYSPETDRDD